MSAPFFKDMAVFKEILLCLLVFTLKIFISFAIREIM